MARKNEYIVVGFKKIDYTKSSGKEVHGCEVFLQPVEKDEGVQGVQCEAIYLSDTYATFKPELNVCVRKLYNQWGKVEDLAVI